MLIKVFLQFGMVGWRWSCAVGVDQFGHGVIPGWLHAVVGMVDSVTDFVAVYSG